MQVNHFVGYGNLRRFVNLAGVFDQMLPHPESGMTHRTVESALTVVITPSAVVRSIRPRLKVGNGG